MCAPLNPLRSLLLESKRETGRVNVAELVKVAMPVTRITAMREIILMRFFTTHCKRDLAQCCKMYSE